MKDTIKKVIKYAMSAGLAVVLLYFSFKEVEWKDFVEGLAACRWEFIIMSMAAGACAFWVRAIRWRQLLLPIDDSITRITTFNGINIGNISNFVFPRIGEFVRCGVITRRSALVDSAADVHSAADAHSAAEAHSDADAHSAAEAHSAAAGHGGAASEPNAGRTSAAEAVSSDGMLQKKASYEKVLGTVVLERGWELLVMILLLAVLVVGGFERFGGFFIEQIWTPMASRLNFSIWWVVAVLGLAISAGAWAIWKYHRTNTLCGKVWGVFKGVFQGFSSCLHMERKWLFFAYTALIWMLYWFMAASTMWAAPFMDHLDLIDALFLSLVGGFGFAVPVPGGIGAFHFIISLALSAVYDVPMETGIIYATLSHTSQAITQIVFGLGSYAHEALRSN